MPWKSEAQRKYLYAVHPKVAAKFAADTPAGKDLPSKIGSQSAADTKKETIRQKAMQKMASKGD